MNRPRSTRPKAKPATMTDAEAQARLAAIIAESGVPVMQARLTDESVAAFRKWARALKGERERGGA